MIYVLQVIFWIFLTLAAYWLARKLHFRFNYTFTLPVLIGTVAIVLLLVLTGIPYGEYMEGGRFIHELLGPAVVALAYPLYLQRKLLVKLFIPIFIGTFIGALIGITTGMGLAAVFGVEPLVIRSLVAKSVTTPVAMAITESIGGIPSLAVVFVMIAGIGGTMIYPFVFKFFHIHDPISRGIGIGSASHGIGTAQSFGNSEREGSAGTVAMVLSAVFVSIIAPLFVQIWL